MHRTNQISVWGLILVLSCGSGAAAEWHYPLCLDGGGLWRGRVVVQLAYPPRITEAGCAALAIEAGTPAGALAGQAIGRIRVCDEQGAEVKFAVEKADGTRITEGAAAERGRLVLPFGPETGASRTCYVYFDNPLAQDVPDFLSVRNQPSRARAKATAVKVERLQVTELGRDTAWPDGMPCDHRARVQVANLSAEKSGSGIAAAVDLGLLEARMRGRLNPASIRVLFDGKPVDWQRAGNRILIASPERTSAPSVVWYDVFFSDDAAIRPADTGQSGRAETKIPPVRNLVKNGGFEEGGEVPTDWTTSPPGKTGTGTSPLRSERVPQGKTGTGTSRVRSEPVPVFPEGVTLSFDDPKDPALGKRCVRLHVPATAPEGWRGWRQSVAVRPGHTYLLSAQVKCQDVQGELRMHLHLRDAAGKLCKPNGMTSIGGPITGTAGWTFLGGSMTMPRDCATLEIHLTMNRSGTVWYDNVLASEVTPARITALDARPMATGENIKVWPEPAVVKVFRDDPTPREAGAAEIASAKHEREPLQLAIRSGKPVRGVRVEVEPPRGPGGAELKDVAVNVVGYVPIDHTTSYYRSEGPEWRRMVPDRPGQCDGWPGMWPDPLLPTDRFDLEANATQALWLMVAVPKDAVAGDYRGEVRLTAGGARIASVPYRVHVWDFTLPEERHLAAIYDVRFGRGNELWGGSLDQAYPEIVRFMAERRLCADHVRPDPQFRLENGRVAADFAAFDQAAEEYFDRLKMPFAYTPSFFYLFGWGHPPKALLGEEPYPGKFPYENVDRGKLRPEYKQRYQECLRVFWEHLKGKGWEKKFVLYISDEPYDRYEHIQRQMKALCDMIHEVDRAIPIYSSTWRHVPAWDGYLDIWGIGHDGRVPVEKMAELTKAGDRLWFTTDGQMCTDTPYCGVERLLPHYCFKYGVQAYEFWGVSWWTYDPYRFGWHSYIHQTSEPGKSFFVRYPNGDGFLLYPGKPIGQAGPVSSIRLEQARDGAEDYEYLYLLKQRIDAAAAAGRDAARARRAMDAAQTLVTIPNAGGRYSSRILPDPDLVYRVRRQVAEAVEGR